MGNDGIFIEWFDPDSTIRHMVTFLLRQPVCKAMPENIRVPRRGRRLGARSRLLRDLILLLAVTGGGMLAAVFYAGESLRDDLAVAQLEELSRKTTADFIGFFQPATQVLKMARDWGAAGELDLHHSHVLSARFIPVLRSLPRASALVIADTDGRSYYLGRDGEGWLSRSLDSQGQGTWQLWDDSGQALVSHEGNMDFDPRSRPWFKGTMDTDETTGIYWTRPYLFHTQRIPGVTGAIAYRVPSDEGRRYVLGLDLPLDGILAELSKLPIGNGGSAFLVEAGGAVLLPPERGEEADERFPVSLAAERFPAGPVLTAVATWKAMQRPLRQAFEFHNDGAWWARLSPLGARQDGLWLGITLPEGDFLGALRAGWWQVLLTGVLVLAAGGLLVAVMSRHYGHQLRNLPALTEDPGRVEERVLGLIRAGESPTLEFKSTLRTNLKTGKPGKEIELAWLKGVVGFLNTDGGVLLVGVDDAGELLGLQADGFENEDKCLLHFKNLFNQHIGAEYARYVQADLLTVQAKQILAVTCERSQDPVFLMVGKNEEFHIRSGPSSMKLSPRQMLAYLGRH